VRYNTVGHNSLGTNSTGDHNSAFGSNALATSGTGGSNTAVGADALINTTGHDNTAIGTSAGLNQTNGSGCIYIGSGMQGLAADSNHTYIQNIGSNPQPVGGSTYAVTVNSLSSRLGYDSSSRRYKTDVKQMDEASEAIFALKPVTYRYKKDIDPEQTPSFGFIAEEVAKVNPALALHNARGQAEGVRYEAIYAMLLNEFLKEHKAFVEEQHKVEKLQSTVGRQQTQIEALTTGLLKVSAQLAAASPSASGLEVSKASPRTVLNNQ
jgi:hypothetical protein